MLERATEAFEQHEYDDAVAVATRAIHRDDPRFAQVSDEARQLIDKAQNARKQWRVKVDEIRDVAERAANAEDFESVIEILSPFPASVLGESLARSLALARSQAAAVGELSLRLRRSIQNKDLLAAGKLVEELRSLCRKHKEYANLAGKIGTALLQSATRRFQKGRYADALARLDAMPEGTCGTEEYRSLRSRTDEAVWLMDQISNSPFVTPSLVRFAQRLTKLDSHNVNAPELLQRLAAKARSIHSDAQSLYAVWDHEPRGWANAPITVLNRPQRITGDDSITFAQNPTRFAIAMGLALQGIGLGSCKGCLSSVPKKSGLKGILGRVTRVEAAWGIDVGASAIRAIRLEQTSDGVQVGEASIVSYDSPRTGARNNIPPSAEVHHALQEIAERIAASGNDPVWCNMPSRETLGRFVTLPPAAEKALVKIVENEATHGFPVPSNELCVTHIITNRAGDETQRAVLVAARREGVEQREKMFAEAGIKISGVQADPLALHNFARHEFSECLGGQNSTGGVPDGIVLIDGGASGVTFYMATKDVFWFRFVDGGGEDLTACLATACEVPWKQAESLKIDPSAIAPLSSAMRGIESRMHQTSARLSQCYRNAIEFSGELRLKHIFCTGGTPLTHGWIRHVLQSSLD